MDRGLSLLKPNTLKCSGQSKFDQVDFWKYFFIFFWQTVSLLSWEKQTHRAGICTIFIRLSSIYYGSKLKSSNFAGYRTNYLVYPFFFLFDTKSKACLFDLIRRYAGWRFKTSYFMNMHPFVVNS